MPCGKRRGREGVGQAPRAQVLFGREKGRREGKERERWVGKRFLYPAKAVRGLRFLDAGLPSDILLNQSNKLLLGYANMKTI